MAAAPSLRKFLELPDHQRHIGAFHLLRPLGKGGFAPVWLAEEVYGETRLRSAAVKLFALDGERDGKRTSGTPGATDRERERIVEEARALCRVEHPNVVRFYALATDDERGVVGLAMEHVDGDPLDAILARSGQLGVLDALEVGVAIASALSVVHQTGLVHRDVKPANVVRTPGGYKLIDFGIAAAERAPKKRQKEPEIEAPREVLVDHFLVEAVGSKASLLQEHSEPEPSAPMISGTIGYIDPVCMSTTAVAVSSSDLYGLGVLVFECLAGFVPSVVANKSRSEPGPRTDVLYGTERAPSLGSAHAGLPEALVRLVDALLDPTREKRPSSAEAVARELERVRAEIAGKSRPLPPEDVGPFRGLGRFEESDRDVYFGRRAEVAAAVELLRGHGLVALVGSSGSGKSSLARAGVLPAVLDGALGRWPAKWDRVVVSPGPAPYRAIVDGIARVVPAVADARPEDVVSAIAEHVQSSGRGLIVLVDQLEELTTIAHGEARAAAAQLLQRLGEVMLPGVRTVVAARRDLLDPLLALGNDFGRVLTRGMMLVSPMGEAAWAEVLDQAIAAYGYSFEDDALRGEILASLEDTTAAMPLVQFALTQLWRQRDEREKRITRKGFRAIGGIAGALDRHAEATVARLPGDQFAALAATRSLMLALTTAEGTRASRTREQLLEEVGSAAIVDTFEDARLIVRLTGGYTLAHESLLGHWERLRSWLAEAREDRLIASELEGDAARFSASSDPTLLWRKRRLLVAEETRKKGTVRLSVRASEFVAASRSEERKGRLIAGTVGAVVIAIGVVLGVVYVGKIRAAQRAAEGSAETSRRNERIAQDNEREAIDAKKKEEEARAKTEEEKVKVKQNAEKVEQVLKELTDAVNDSKACRELLKKPLLLPAAIAIAPTAAGTTTAAPTATAAPTSTVQIE